MGYGWATIFTVGAWLVGGFLDAFGVLAPSV